MLNSTNILHKKIHKKKKRYKKQKIKINFKVKTDFSLVCGNLNQITDKPLEAARRIINKTLLRVGKIFIQIIPQIIITKKPKGSRMGKGAGKFHNYISLIKPGAIIFRIYSFFFKNSLNALKNAKKKIGFKSYILYKLNSKI